MSAIEQVYPSTGFADRNERREQVSSGIGVAVWVWPIALTLISVVIYELNTHHGIGILPDSTRYLGVTDTPYDAPLYPWLLDAASLLIPNSYQAAEVIGFVLICANTLLAWHLLRLTTGRPAYAGMATAIIILGPNFVGLHAAAMSEPPFFFFLLVSLLLIRRFWLTDNRIWLVGCGLAIGAAALTRFTAPPMGAAIALGLLLNRRLPLARRVMDAGILAVVSGAIFLGWCITSQLLVGRSIGRDLDFYGNMNAAAWHGSLVTLSTWLIPSQIPVVVRLLFLGIVVCASVALLHRQIADTLQRSSSERVVDELIPTVLAAFFVFYLAFFFLAASIEANQQLTPRYALPIYVMSIVMMAIVLAEAHGRRSYIGFLHGTLVAAASLTLISHVVRTADKTRIAYAQGIGYASVAWKHSPTMRALAKLPPDVLIFSNGPDAIGYALRREARFIPMRELPRTGRPDPAHPFGQEILEFRHDHTPGTKIFVFFNAVTWRHYLPTEAALLRLLPLKPISQTSDGRIYVLSPAPVGEAKP